MVKNNINNTNRNFFTKAQYYFASISSFDNYIETKINNTKIIIINNNSYNNIVKTKLNNFHWDGEIITR